jgi:hypothetical protein
MEYQNLHEELQNPIFLTGLFHKLRDEARLEGFPSNFADLRTAIALAPAFAGMDKLNDQEMDKFTRIIIAIVDAVYYRRN